MLSSSNMERKTTSMLFSALSSQGHRPASPTFSSVLRRFVHHPHHRGNDARPLYHISPSALPTNVPQLRYRPSLGSVHLRQWPTRVTGSAATHRWCDNHAYRHVACLQRPIRCGLYHTPHVQGRSVSSQLAYVPIPCLFYAYAPVSSRRNHCLVRSAPDGSQ